MRKHTPLYSDKHTYNEKVIDTISSQTKGSIDPPPQSPPLKKSTRDWSKTPSTSVLDLSLISRSSNNTAEPSLKNVELQIELWNEICKQTMQVKGAANDKQWVYLAGLLRKLREGVWASHWSEGNIRFAVKVYEESVHTSLRAQEYPEFRKAIRGLVDDLYKLYEKGYNGHFLALDVIYQACHLHQYQPAMHTLLLNTTSLCYNRNEISYAKNVIRALSTNHWIQFFRLYHHAPHPAYHIIMEPAIVPMRQHALNVMQKAYYTAPLPWLSSALGFNTSNDSLIHSLHTLDTHTIDRIENDVLYFKKKRK